jgi:hypothetical protein
VWSVFGAEYGVIELIFLITQGLDRIFINQLIPSVFDVVPKNSLAQNLSPNLPAPWDSGRALGVFQ